MTVIVATHRELVSDSLVTVDDLEVLVGKIYRRKGGGIFGTSGDDELTGPFTDAMRIGRKPLRPDGYEDSGLECVLLLPNGQLFHYGASFKCDEIVNPYFAIGAGAGIAMSWMREKKDPVEAVRRAILDCRSCGAPIVRVPLVGKPQIIEV